MIRTRHIAAFGAAIAILTQWAVAPSAGPLPGGQDASVSRNQAPTTEQVRSIILRALENQHRDDRASEEFERVERVITRKPGENSDKVSDRTERIVPFGAGTVKLQVAENGAPVSQELYRRELRFALGALELAIHPDERYKQDLVKFEKRRRDRAELVDTSVKAFRITWAGRETQPDPAGGHGSRTLTKFLLDPDPNYKPADRLAVTFEHVHAALWVDESQAQIARVEGDIASDITFGGGLIGKIYHGGHFLIEQSEVAPGVWLPTLYTYDVDGRKLLFGFGVHERTEISGYRRVGPPSEAIEIIRNELKNLPTEANAH